MSDSVQVQKGLEGVVADTTAVSLVDGEAGRLYYRGQPIESLIRHTLCRGPAPGRVRRAAGPPTPAGSRGISVGRRPAAAGAGDLAARAGASRRASDGDAAGHHAAPGPGAAGRQPRPLGAGRGRPDRRRTLAGRDRPDPCRARRSPGAAVSRARVATASAFCNCCTTATPTPEQVKAFEVTQILQLDHSFNAGTFAARVVSSTLAPPSVGAVGRNRRAVRSAARRRRSGARWRWHWKSAARSKRARSSRIALRPAGW